MLIKVDKVMRFDPIHYDHQLRHSSGLYGKKVSSIAVSFLVHVMCTENSLSLSSKVQNASTPPKGRYLSAKETKIQLINGMFRNISYISQENAFEG
uniref:Uncharacterized protein n=1 Tax=Setaria italica TaxID=4555 RepID=K3ZB63_SETIT